MKIRRALISVSDKTGLDVLARGLVDRGVELVSTSGTAAYLEEQGLPVRRVEDLTGVPELMGGRVRTLHPRIHGGLLARRDAPDDMRALEEQGIEPIDLAVVNLYPFSRLAARRGPSDEELIEAIDIGGPAMVRAAAKNYHSVAVVVDPDRYGFLLDEMDETGGLSLPTRRELAGEAFAHTAGYDISIANWFNDAESFPERLQLELVKVTDLSYGENPHQHAAYYMEAGVRRHLLSRVTQHSGRMLSFNNLLDLDAATSLVGEFTLPACAVVKHGNPCGAALAATIEEAFERAWEADPVSAYGSVVAFNRAVTVPLAERVASRFIEVVHAPGYAAEALARLAEKRDMRVLDDQERRRAALGERDYRRVSGGMLVQERDSESEERAMMEVATSAQPSEGEWGDLLFAWRVAKHVRSNAIVLARELATVGVGAGQMSRVDSVRLAVAKADGRAEGAVLASDAFFPFADGVEQALAAGVRVFVQPGGSKRDADVVDAVESAGAVMVLTGRRHFAH